MINPAWIGALICWINHQKTLKTGCWMNQHPGSCWFIQQILIENALIYLLLLKDLFFLCSKFFLIFHMQLPYQFDFFLKNNFLDFIQASSGPGPAGASPCAADPAARTSISGNRYHIYGRFCNAKSFLLTEFIALSGIKQYCCSII